MNASPFFIVGVGRSGTTLLRLMLHNHPDIAIPYESHFITDYIERIEDYGDLENEDNLESLVKDILAEDLLAKWDHVFKVKGIVNSVADRSLAGVIDAIYSEYARAKNKKRWGDKSDYLSRLHEINGLFPESKFIHIIRDGRDVARSVMKMSWGPNDIIEAAEWWHQYVRLGRCMGSVLGEDRYMEVRFEDLVLDSKIQLTRICDFLGERFDPLMLEYHKSGGTEIPTDRIDQHYNSDSPPKRARTHAWRTEMKPIDIAVFDNYASETLRALGYSVPEQRIGSFRLKLAKIRIYAKRALA